MKPLVIHMDDRSTDFLRPIYAHLDCDVVTHPVEDLDLMIHKATRVIMLGHGSPNGLFNQSMATGNPYIIGPQNAKDLRKKDNVYIWCNAQKYVEHHRLKGFSTSMFISEVGEARFCGITATQAQVDASNHTFAELVGEVINSPSKHIFDRVKAEYVNVACKVTTYNNRGLLYFG